jgi:RNA polymerase sigma factor (sigma-70 family)
MNVQEIAPLAEPGKSVHRTGAKSAPSDERLLVAQPKSGCSNAFGELYEYHRQRTYHTVLRMLGNRHDAEDDDGLSVFLSTRARLLGIAYRILKSAAEAEDLVQDVWIRWQTTDHSTVRDAAAFLMTMTKRLAINVVRSARSRREACFASSLEESVDTSPDPRVEAERSEQLRGAVLVLLEKLSPVERAAYVLREAFDYSYREIAKILRLEVANVRQLVTRARQHVADGQHSSVNSAEQRSFLAAFLAAAQRGALAKFESFLVGSVDGTVRKGEQPLRTSSTLDEPIKVPRQHAKLKEAVAIEDSIDDLSQPPYPVIPATELCGYLLLELKRPTEAVGYFNITLKRTLNRPKAILASPAKVAAAAH